MPGGSCGNENRRPVWGALIVARADLRRSQRLTSGLGNPLGHIKYRRSNATAWAMNQLIRNVGGI